MAENSFRKENETVRVQHLITYPEQQVYEEVSYELLDQAKYFSTSLQKAKYFYRISIWAWKYDLVIYWWGGPHARDCPWERITNIEIIYHGHEQTFAHPYEM